MNNSILSYFILSFTFFNLNLADKCTYTVPTNGYTTTYEIECPPNTNTGGSGTNVPTQTQVYYDPTYYNRGYNNMNYQTLGSNTNNVVYYYTDSTGNNYQYTNTNNQACNCGTMNCQCTTYYYYPTGGSSSAQLRNRPRGLGLLTLPTGVADERTGPFVPGLYVAGDKPSLKPQTVEDIHLPGQTAHFSGRTKFDPFTQAVAAVYTEDLIDSWGFGYAVNGVNNYGLKVKENFDQFADVPLFGNNGGMQPFINSFVVGSEFDLKKIKDIAANVEVPILGLNEMFDFDGKLFVKGNANGVFQGYWDLPLTLSDPQERAAGSMKYLNYQADRHYHYGHTMPSMNLFLLDKEKIIERLTRNRANPAFVG
uniref:Peptidase A1 domain-containing protein n=1 Tax=Strongyloides papillosus TaxID=174720 RepID=A0A0N5C332_STREA